MGFIVNEEIKEQLKSVPQEPGVYLMKDKAGDIIYVGKSKNLKNRLSSYFRAIDSHLPKVKTMVINVSTFEYILTDTEVEALILEANLIKKHLPRFNILLKDDKSYPYIVVTSGEAFPRVMMTRQFHKNTHKYFGPYTSSEDVRIALDVIQTLYPIRECNRVINDKIQRPCLNYHIGRCAGVCNHKISKEDYGTYIKDIIRFLNGDKEHLLKQLEHDMQKSALEMNFEHAAELRDQISALRGLNEKQKAFQPNEVNQDYIGFYSHEENTCVMVFQVRNGKIDGRESYILTNAAAAGDADILTAFIKQYYSASTFVPKEIYLSHALVDSDVYSTWLTKLTGTKVHISSPLKGDKKQTILLVQKNAKEYMLKFQKSIKRDSQIKAEAESELRTLLGFPDNVPLSRIEAFDISNIMGVYSVGSMVVYENGLKKRSDYRRYKIKTIEGANDYGSMQEVLYRRFKRALEERDIAHHAGVNTKGHNHLPDLVLIDGGKGHVNAVQDVMNALKLDVPVAGMVKDSQHKTHDLYFDGELKQLKAYKKAFRLVYDIQEEVHRFAIEYHRSLRSKEMTHSILDDISGVGPTRRRALLAFFGSVESISKASLDALEQAKGIDKKTAKNVFDFFHNNSESSENSKNKSV